MGKSTIIFDFNVKLPEGKEWDVYQVFNCSILRLLYRITWITCWRTTRESLSLVHPSNQWTIPYLSEKIKNQGYNLRIVSGMSHFSFAWDSMVITVITFNPMAS